MPDPSIQQEPAQQTNAGSVERSDAPTTQSARGGELEMLPMLLMAAGFLVLIFVMMKAARRRAARSAADPGLSGTEKMERLREQASRDEMTGMMVDVQRLAQDVAAQLDNRAARLEVLLDRADQTIARLERAHAPQPDEITQHGRWNGAHDRRPDVDAPEPVQRAVRTQPERPATSTPRRSGIEPGEHTRIADPLAGEIYRLADEGRTAVEIAKQLSQHTGKVELILALRNG